MTKLFFFWRKFLFFYLRFWRNCCCFTFLTKLYFFTFLTKLFFLFKFFDETFFLFRFLTKLLLFTFLTNFFCIYIFDETFVFYVFDKTFCKREVLGMLLRRISYCEKLHWFLYPNIGSFIVSLFQFIYVFKPCNCLGN